MSRARNIKPGFFKNEQLADLPFEFRILFQGLWCEADRDGRLEDRPKRLKAEIFPYDVVDVDAGLNALQAAGFIVRYEAEGRRCIEVLNFAKHQNPHKKEASSSLPGRVPEIPGQLPDAPKLAPEIPERAGLIPDSLIPDSLLTEPNGSGADAPSADNAKAADPIWHTGLAFLKRKGIPEKPARAYLGKLRGDVGDITAAGLLAKAEQDDVSDPIPWLSRAALSAKNRPRGSPDKPSAAANFADVTYTGTAYEDMPADLRPEIEDHAA